MNKTFNINEKYVHGRAYIDEFKGRQYLFLDMSGIKGIHDKNGVDIIGEFIKFFKDFTRHYEGKIELLEYILVDATGAKSSADGITKLKELMGLPKAFTS